MGVYWESRKCFAWTQTGWSYSFLTTKYCQLNLFRRLSISWKFLNCASWFMEFVWDRKKLHWVTLSTTGWLFEGASEELPRSGLGLWRCIESRYTIWYDFECWNFAPQNWMRCWNICLILPSNITESLTVTLVRSRVYLCSGGTGPAVRYRIALNTFYLYSPKSKLHYLRRLYNLLSEGHPLSPDPRLEWGKPCMLREKKQKNNNIFRGEKKKMEETFRRATDLWITSPRMDKHAIYVACTEKNKKSSVWIQETTELA